MRLSYIIYSRNQCDALLETISALPDATPLRPEHWQIWVVDDASQDDTSKILRENFISVNVLQTKSFRGRSALNEAFKRADSEFVIWLDAATRPPNARSVKQALEHLLHRPRTGAVAVKVNLSEGGSAAPDLPTLLMPGATCIRRSVLRRVGGFDSALPGSLADMDLSFRIWQQGYEIQRRDDIVFERTGAYSPEPINFAAQTLLARKYLPPQYVQDWSMRSGAMLRMDGGFLKSRQEQWKSRFNKMRGFFGSPTLLNEATLQNIFGFRKQSEVIGQWARQHSVWRVVLADFGVNAWATYNACKSTGLQLRCVADSRPAFAHREYRGLPIVPVAKAFEGGGIDGVILTNVNPSEIDQCARTIRHYFKGPILRLWQPPKLATQANIAQAA